MARTKRLRGYNVLHPFGWDAFGLPAENAAIKSGIHPETSTLANIAHMKGQLQRLGISYAWEREFATCEPTYYKWNQWLFIKMYERGLAYRRRSSVNWCEKDQTVLANEQVVDGGCWRCGTPVTTRDLEQWFFKITQYADDLLKGIEHLGQWPEKVLTMQKNWIGQIAGHSSAVSRSGWRGVCRRLRHDRGLHHAARHDFRRDVCVSGARARDGREVRDAVGRSRCVPQARDRVSNAGPHRAADRRNRKGRILHRPVREESVHRRAHSHLDCELRAGRVRHWRGDGGAGARPARLRVRDQVQPADQSRRPSGSRPGTRVEADRQGVRRLRAAGRVGRVHRPDVRGGARAHGRVGRAAGHRQADRAVPPEGLGNLAPALLGHARFRWSTATRAASCRCRTSNCRSSCPK